jgi:hypothetical protein
MLALSAIGSAEHHLDWEFRFNASAQDANNPTPRRSSNGGWNRPAALPNVINNMNNMPGIYKTGAAKKLRRRPISLNGEAALRGPDGRIGYQDRATGSRRCLNRAGSSRFTDSRPAVLVLISRFELCEAMSLGQGFGLACAIAKGISDDWSAARSAKAFGLVPPYRKCRSYPTDTSRGTH